MKYITPAIATLITMAIGWIFYEVFSQSKKIDLLEYKLNSLYPALQIMAEESNNKPKIIRALMKAKKSTPKVK